MTLRLRQGNQVESNKSNLFQDCNKSNQGEGKKRFEVNKKQIFSSEKLINSHDFEVRTHK